MKGGASYEAEIGIGSPGRSVIVIVAHEREVWVDYAFFPFQEGKEYEIGLVANDHEIFKPITEPNLKREIPGINWTTGQLPNDVVKHQCWVGTRNNTRVGALGMLGGSAALSTVRDGGLLRGLPTWIPPHHTLFIAALDINTAMRGDFRTSEEWFPEAPE